MMRQELFLPYFMINFKTKETILSIGFPIIFSVSCIIFGIWILPENCSLFVSNRVGPQMCHTIPLPEGCFESFCNDIALEATASMIVGFGIFLLLVPIIFILLKDFYKTSAQNTKLFD